MPPFGAWERVKGKRVQIPHDLVTVIRELCGVGAFCAGHWGNLREGSRGRGQFCPSLSARKPACCWYGSRCSRSRGIGCTEKPRNNRGLFVVHPRGKRALFVSGRTACTLSVRRSAHKQKQERNKQELCVNSIGKRPWQSPPLWRSASAPWQAAAAALPAAPPLPARQHPALPPAR